MDKNFLFLNFDGLDDNQVEHLKELLHPSNFSAEIEFPWNEDSEDEQVVMKGCASSLNVHAPVFEAYVSKVTNHTVGVIDHHSLPYNKESNDVMYMNVAQPSCKEIPTLHHGPMDFSNGSQAHQGFECYEPCAAYSNLPKVVNGDLYSKAHSPQLQTAAPIFKLNPTVSCFVPQNIKQYAQQTLSNGIQMHTFEPNTNAQQTFQNDVLQKFDTGVLQKFEPSGAQQKFEPSGAQQKFDTGVPQKFEPPGAQQKFDTGVPQKFEPPGAQQLFDSGVLQKCEPSAAQQKIVHRAQEKFEPSIEQKLEPNIENRNKPNLIKNEPIRQNFEPNMQHKSERLQQNIEPVLLEKIETTPQQKTEPEFQKKIDSCSLQNFESNRNQQNLQSSVKHENVSVIKVKQNEGTAHDSNLQSTPNGLEPKTMEKVNVLKTNVKTDKSTSNSGASGIPSRRSWADVVSSSQRPGDKVSLAKSVTENNKKSKKLIVPEQEDDTICLDEDKMSLALGKHLYQVSLKFQPVFLQPRGLINRRNWCYINATLQALLACPPFYTLIRELPIGPCVDRGKSATPVLDSLLKVAYEFSEHQSQQEDFQVGTPFQPDFIYDMLKEHKSDCLKGQQEDAEEFLSFMLNGMHEEMVKIIKYYEKKHHLHLDNDLKENGDASEGEEEWQVIGSKHKGMVTRKVAEHKTPISDLLGGQIKSFLTTSGSKTSASIQPFFTLQLDVQSENVTSVSEALKEMTVKEPIQGYTCAKTKQEVEAYSHIALQKLPPVLILHLKRFVYNKNGGCKKVLKKTDYPLQLELSKDLFSPDIKKNQRIRIYNLFAVMYHDGEEAIKGHYISDVYNHGCQTWIRCDDRAITAVTETQVLSHSPPRVPYLLFYQESSNQT